MYPRLRYLAVALVAAPLILTACADADLDGEDTTTEDASGSDSDSAGDPDQGSASGELGGYEPVSDVDAHARLVLDMCEVNEALPGDGELDDEAVRAAYTEGGSSQRGDGSNRTLQGAATGGHDEPLWNRYAEHFGSDTFADDFVTAALEGTGEFDGEPDGVRRQGIQKGIQNQVLMAHVFHELDAAAAKVQAGETDAAEGAPHNVDEAWAFYHGADPNCAPYATASKRGEDFGTGEAVNESLLAATERMRDAAGEGDQAAFEEAYDEFVSTALVTYVQATIKYGQVMGEDLAGGDQEAARVHQAEGYAFWRVLAPFIAEADAAAAEEIDAVLALTAEPTEGEGDAIRAALEGVYADLGIDEEQVGEFQSS
ncbi:MAG: FEA1-related lipoprotein [Egibacteraceae bacterium]